MKPAKRTPMLSRRQLAGFRDLAREHGGLELPHYRRAEVERSVARAVHDSGAADPAALFDLMTDPERGRAALEAWLGTLTVGETHFFRNRAQFDALEHHVLPDLLERRRRERRLSVWSAGCSTGEEPYSLAILIDRLLVGRARWNVSILGTDINRRALERAAQGRYGRSSLRGLDPDSLGPHLVPREGSYEVSAHIRQMVRFEYLNLAGDSYPASGTGTERFDLILCRNVLIYLAPEVCRSVATRMYDSLVTGGWLFVGHAEPSQQLFGAFAPRNYPGTVLYQKSARSADPPRRKVIPAAAAAAATGPSPLASRGPRAPGTPLRAEPASTERPAVGRSGGGGGAKAAREPRSTRRPTAARKADAKELYRLATEAARATGLQDAEPWVDRALLADPLLAPAHYLRGLILLGSDQPAAAMESLRRCVFADPDFVLGHFALAGAAARLGLADRARLALATVEGMLAGRDPATPIPEGDGLTVGALRELVALQLDAPRGAMAPAVPA